MRIPLFCPVCTMNAPMASGDILQAAAAPITDSGAYFVRCEAGHELSVILQLHRFQALAEIALQAIIDGYYREAVTSFAASMERVFEFYIACVWISQGVAMTDRQQRWKMVAASSERQIGLFIGVYCAQTGASPVLISQKQTEFRNEVVHKGRIPSENQAVDYGQAVANVVLPLLAELQGKHAEAITVITNARNVLAMKDIKQGIPVSLGIGAIFEPANAHAGIALRDEVTKRRNRGPII